jgi:hypothetical protein
LEKATLNYLRYGEVVAEERNIPAGSMISESYTARVIPTTVGKEGH